MVQLNNLATINQFIACYDLCHTQKALSSGVAILNIVGLYH